MSVVKTNNVQIGQSLTANQNFSWYQPSTPDGTVRLGVGNAGSTTLDAVTVNNSGNVGIGTSSPGAKTEISVVSSDATVNQEVLRISTTGRSAGGGTAGRSDLISFYDASNPTLIGAIGGFRTNSNVDYSGGIKFFYNGAAQATAVSSLTLGMTLDSSGNLGLGASPTSGAIGASSLQVGGVAYFGGHSYTATNNQTVVGNNCYVGTDTSFRYGAYNDVAAMYRISAGGIHQWMNAPSGTAGNAISFTQAMTLDASGNLLVGTTSQLQPGGVVGVANILNSVNNGAWALALQNNATTASLGRGLGIRNVTDFNNTSSEFIYCVGNATPRFYVQSNGGIYNFSANNVNISDERVKTAITPAPSWLPKINAIEVVNFKYKDQTHDDFNLGVIAQQVLEVAPEIINEEGFGETPEDGVPLLSIYETDLMYGMLKAIQELSAEFNELKQEVNA